MDWKIDSTITIVGLIAAAFTTIALLPQLLKVKRTISKRRVHMHVLAVLRGVFLWFYLRFVCFRCTDHVANS
ncbi:MAG: hypothetical protein ACFCUE_13405 [Candidatus Bathyarchaeia archaeon]